MIRSEDAETPWGLDVTVDSDQLVLTNRASIWPLSAAFPTRSRLMGSMGVSPQCDSHIFRVRWKQPNEARRTTRTEFACVRISTVRSPQAGHV